MRIDQSHRKWIIGAAAAFAVATAIYIPYSLLAAHGPTGGSWFGLGFGIAGFGVMVFEVLLSLRKKFPVWRIGRAQTWMRGHIWLGLLTLPLILYHAGFGFGAGLSGILMVLFFLVFISGIFGAALQHYLPQVMMRELPMETIYDQLDNILGQLRQEAETIFSEARPAFELSVPDAADERQIAVATAAPPASSSLEPLIALFTERVQPYLAASGARGSELAKAETARLVFTQVRKMSPTHVYDVLDDLLSICDEKRQLDKQARMHRLLHGWLLVHVPLSWAVLILGAVHAVVALRY